MKIKETEENDTLKVVRKENPMREYTNQLDYSLDTAKERIELLNNILCDKNGYSVKFFEDMFDQDEREDANKSKSHKEDERKFANLLPTCSSALSEDIYECKQIERMADYILKAKDQPRMDKQQEYNFYDESSFNRLLDKEKLYGDIAESILGDSGSDDNLCADELIDMMGVVNPCIKKHNFSKQRIARYTYLSDNCKMAFLKRKENYKLDGKIRIYKSDLSDPELGCIKEWEDEIQKLQAKVKSVGFNNTKRILIDMIRELRDLQVAYKKYKKGIIIFKSPLRDSTVIDYDEFDFFDKTHVLALLNMPSRQITAEDDLSLILYDLELLMENIKIRDTDLEVVEMYRGGMSQEDIAERLGIAQPNVIKVLSKLVDNIIGEYENTYEDWYYLNKVKGKYKRCNRCGETKLQSKFRKDAHKIDGLRYNCRQCD